MTAMDPDDELVLVARLRVGDTRAFDEVYDAYRPKVFAFLLRMARSRTGRAISTGAIDVTRSWRNRPSRIC